MSKSYTPKISPEQINRQSGAPLNQLYRVFEVYGIKRFSILFNKEADALAVCEWKNECHRNWWQKLVNVYKVRERRVHSGTAQTIVD